MSSCIKAQFNGRTKYFIIRLTHHDAVALEQYIQGSVSLVEVVCEFYCPSQGVCLSRYRTNLHQRIAATMDIQWGPNF